MMTTVYTYCMGALSSHKIERACYGGLEPMLQRIAGTAGAHPDVMTMDRATEERATPSPTPIKASRPRSPPAGYNMCNHLHRRGQLPRDADAKTRMTRKLRRKRVSAIYAQRKAIVVPANRQIKEARACPYACSRGLRRSMANST
jgi:hypothetical protein